MLETRSEAESFSPDPSTIENPPLVLLPEQMAESDGIGPQVDVGTDQGKLLVLTLSIDRVVEKGVLVVSVWGSSDGHD